jgi:cation transport ATPase
VQGSDVAQAAAEVILLNDDLRTIPWLIGLARQALGKVRQNLAWAFFYNLVGLTLAVTGHMQPVIAALLMVANSALVTWNGLRLRHAGGEEPLHLHQTGDRGDKSIATAVGRIPPVQSADL